MCNATLFEPASSGCLSSQTGVFNKTITLNRMTVTSLETVKDDLLKMVAFTSAAQL